jgi:hypothetical protein
MMMLTAIFTDQKTTLTIETTESLTLNLEQRGGKNPPTKLAPGVNEVNVEAGVFKVLSKNALRVSATTPNLYVASTQNTKDDNFPDPPRWTITHTELRAFLADGRDAGNDPALK